MLNHHNTEPVNTSYMVIELEQSEQQKCFDCLGVLLTFHASLCMPTNYFSYLTYEVFSFRVPTLTGPLYMVWKLELMMCLLRNVSDIYID